MSLLRDFSRYVLFVLGFCGYFYVVEYLAVGSFCYRVFFSFDGVAGGFSGGRG